MNCPVCGAAGVVVAGRPREATVGTVAVLCATGPVVACPDGHRAPPDVGDAVVAACRGALPHARARRLRRIDVCERCGTPLTMPVRRTVRPVTVDQIDGLPVTTLRFDLPTTRCPECSTDQVPTRSADDVAAAARAAFTPSTGSPGHVGR